MLTEDGQFEPPAPLPFGQRLIEAGRVIMTGQVQREEPEPEPSRGALVHELQCRVREARTFWQPVFNLMREELRFAQGKQWPGQTLKDERYVANIVQRQVNMKVSSLYAKNPRAVARRRPKLDFQLWDGKQSTLQAAQATMSQMAAASMGMAQGQLTAGGMGMPTPQPPPGGMDPMQAQAIL